MKKKCKEKRKERLKSKKREVKSEFMKNVNPLFSFEYALYFFLL